MEDTGDSLLKTARKGIGEIEPNQIELLSLFVFVLFTTFVTMMSLVSLDRLVEILTGAEVWNGGVADNDGDGFPMYRAIFPVEPEQAMIIPKLGRLAFVVVIGQIINTTNQKVAEYGEYGKSLSLIGIGFYLLLFFLIQGKTYEVVWVLSVQFFTLAYYSLTVPVGLALTKLVRVWDDSTKQDQKKRLYEKRPRIRNPRN